MPAPKAIDIIKDCWTVDADTDTDTDLGVSVVQPPLQEPVQQDGLALQQSIADDRHGGCDIVSREVIQVI